jgi:hypothetical protein
MRDLTFGGVAIRVDELPADESVIAALENEIGGSLPPEYRSFLLACNGGKPTPDGFRLPREGTYSDSLVNWFYAAMPGSPIDLGKKWRLFRGRMPPGLRTIANDPFGNQICIGVSGEARGKIYFWDHEREQYPADWSNVDLIAESFDAFLRGLTAD